MLYAPEAFRRHPCRVFASEPGLQGSPQTKSILQTSHSSPIGGGGVGKRKETAISVSISQESVGINNRRSFNPALIAAHSGIALRRRLLHKSINEYSNTPSLPLRSQRSISTEYSIRANIHLTLSRMPSDTRVLSTSTAFTATFPVDFPCSIAGKALATHFPVPTTEEVLAMSYMCAALFMREERQNRTPNKNLCYHIALLLTN